MSCVPVAPPPVAAPEAPAALAEPPLDPIQRVTLSSQDVQFYPTNLTVQAGRKVVLTIQNAGAHTFTVAELGIDKNLGPGTNTIVFTPERAGTYKFYCSIPGHREQGMIGTLVVQ